jgi:inositol hexakisphosphate/diphosphoinositol-pentakisphosphate kinase
MKSLVHQLRELCLAERVDSVPTPQRRFSSMSQDPKEWGLDPTKPCSGEKPLLMFDRWV